MRAAGAVAGWALALSGLAGCGQIGGTARNDLGRPGWAGSATPHFTIVSNANAEKTRRIAVRFERLARELEIRSGGVSVDGGRPIRLFVFRSGQQFRHFGDDPRTPVFFRSREGAFVAVNTRELPSQDFEPAQRAVVRELLRHYTEARLPAWWVEALAQFLGSLRIERNTLVLGAEPAGLLAGYDAGDWIPLAELLADAAVDHPGFEAQCWLLIHHASLGNPERLAGLQQLALRLASGEALEAAYAEVFGESPAVLDAEVRGYLTRRRFPFDTRRFDPDDAKAVGLRGRPLPLENALAELSMIYVYRHPANPGPVEALHERALELEPGAALPLTARARWLEHEGRFGDAALDYAAASAVAPEHYDVRVAEAHFRFRRARDGDPGEASPGRAVREQRLIALRDAIDAAASSNPEAARRELKDARRFLRDAIDRDSRP
ncbi:MAG: hypothetical protein MJE66_21930 [Proteobacteria bacterium]|nr:hypothetical protein [Pseudomonadota bacterium]